MFALFGVTFLPAQRGRLSTGLSTRAGRLTPTKPREAEGMRMAMKLKTDAEIDAALHSQEAVCVLGLNKRNLITLQLPAGNDYIVLDADQAEELAGLLCKHAERSRSLGGK